MCFLRVLVLGAAPTWALFHAWHQNTATGSGVFLIKQVTLQASQKGTLALFQVFKDPKQKWWNKTTKIFWVLWGKGWLKSCSPCCCYYPNTVNYEGEYLHVPLEQAGLVTHWSAWDEMIKGLTLLWWKCYSLLQRLTFFPLPISPPSNAKLNQLLYSARCRCCGDL